jgi:Nucleotidyltransferase of unknown function (DUF6036)
MSDFLFDANATVMALEALADLLASERIAHQSLIVVGGSYLALTELRESTRDIDSVTRIEDATKRAIERIGNERGYATNWLNDAAAAFRPTGLAAHDCTVLFERSALTILGPSADWIFLMKLFAGRSIDHEDLVRLWPHTGFTTSAEVIRRFQEAYPHEPEDPFLDEYIDAICQRAEGY